ncbi:SDR family NAD(P)-dependent oxidoreductase [Galactobacter caseinivorans]|uniref:SDR family NAD(P)-dependent oxidoreductase n=1 Tax=Galactobacter caseinivorans TaxID=2676123 RepID=A0A496PIT6_9MICC|nr:SDR family NAD(P)-dependent oxidoreductase [Galactobacter caseinivorans]RKW70394.1 SDR family NAD(P)-dependent oxidoreductase [Galactobacter caseinivorans]
MPLILPDHSGRTVLITGPTSGLGQEAARRFAEVGAHVILAARNPEKAAQTMDRLRADQPDAQLSFRAVDLGSRASIEAFSRQIEADGQSVDTLINNAGVMMPPTRFETEDGHELQWGTNFLGAYLLTAGLLPTLLRSDRPRVATQASFMGHLLRFNDQDPESERRYVPWRAYSNSKLADLGLALRLAELSQEHGWGLRSTAAHPGFTSTGLMTAGPQMRGNDGKERGGATNAALHSAAPGAMPVELGVEAILLAAGAESAPQAAYFGPSKRFGTAGPGGIVKLPRVARGRDFPAQVEAAAERSTGVWLAP